VTRSYELTRDRDSGGACTDDAEIALQGCALRDLTGIEKNRYPPCTASLLLPS
jgi:hypothetical protein